MGDLQRAPGTIRGPGGSEVVSPTDRPNTALIVIGMQKGVLAKAWEREQVVENVRSLVDRARRESVPVIWVQHSEEQLPYGSEAWEMIPDLVPVAGEEVVQKQFHDSFEDTELEEILDSMNVGRVLVVGAQTDACIRATLHSAFVRGYDTTLVSDAHTTEDMAPWGATITPKQAVEYTNLYWTWARAPGRQGVVVPSEQVDFGGAV